MKKTANRMDCSLFGNVKKKMCYRSNLRHCVF